MCTEHTCSTHANTHAHARTHAHERTRMHTRAHARCHKHTSIISALKCSNPRFKVVIYCAEPGSGQRQASDISFVHPMAISPDDRNGCEHGIPYSAIVTQLSEEPRNELDALTSIVVCLSHEEVMCSTAMCVGENAEHSLSPWSGTSRPLGPSRMHAPLEDSDGICMG